MKAIQIQAYGGTEVLKVIDVPRPEPAPGEVLIHVQAAGVNPADIHIRSGFATMPPEYRPANVLSLPRILGSDVSGIVEEIGPGVTAFKKGDAVYGLIRFPSGNPEGAYAEYISAPTEDLALKPESMSHVQAAALPMTALTAWQALFDHANMSKGQTVLINGASGGVGHLAVQIAKAKGAHVIAVASGRNAEFVERLGADQFIDYTKTELENAVSDVDLVIDTVGGPNGGRFIDVLKPGGRLVPIFYGTYPAERAAAAGVTVRGMQVHSNGSQLAAIGQLVDEKLLRVEIESVFPLEEADQAHARIESRRTRGKIVLRVGDEL
ncbi:NADP-dependent oxidoreductase [Paenibacillus durus]|nr:NADP-dependent oxidoreductase [Paenibacillus durus]